MRISLLLSLRALVALALIASDIVAAAPERLPVAHWKFDEEPNSATAVDSTGNGHTTAVVGATRVPREPGSALSFRGSSDYLFASDAQSGGTTGVGLDMRLVDNGSTWSEPVFIGENSAISDVQARQAIVAVDGQVFSMWQRERPFAGGPLPMKPSGRRAKRSL